MDMNQLADQVSNLADFVWNGLLLYLLVGTGIIFTIRTRFIQVRKFGTGFKRLFGSINLNGEKAGKEGMSSFQAVATSIAAQVGTGNITGCATAMISGGPGGPSSGCGWPPSSAWPPSTARPAWRRSTRPPMRPAM